jgi:hypothetical protein
MRDFYRDPKFLRWFDSLKPYDELVARMALRRSRFAPHQYVHDQP